jgi:DNA adenine methylase
MKFLRYPGGKSRLLSHLIKHIPEAQEIKGSYVEPFVGGGSVFFYLQPHNAIISDLNSDLIDLYKGIKIYPHKVWDTFKAFPPGKKSYYNVRDGEAINSSLYFRSARTLYLNRTCFKGMWRHNVSGNFNVGYGGETRRWVITHQNIVELSKALKSTTILNEDYEAIIKNVRKNDFIFLDPPYKPGERDLKEAHYLNGKFSFEDQQRLADILLSIPKSRKIRWAMTNSSHKDIKKLYQGNRFRKLPIGVGEMPGILTKKTNEVLITNY